MDDMQGLREHGAFGKLDHEAHPSSSRLLSATMASEFFGVREH